MNNFNADEELKNLNNLLERRYSCRAFLDKEVPKKTIFNILSCAQKVPSWCNAQPWEVSIVSGERLESLKKLTTKAGLDRTHKPDINFPLAYEGVYRQRRRECAEQLYNSIGIDISDRDASFKQTLRNYEFFDAPCVMIITSPEDLGSYGLLDCGAFITALTLAATATGVASIPQAAIAGLAPIVREFLGLSSTRNIVCAVSFGYPDTNSPVNKFRTTRATMQDVVKGNVS